MASKNIENNKNITSKKFGNILKKLRTDRHLTQKNLASEICCQANTISSYETGTNEPSIEILIKLSNFFDVSLDYLVGISNIKNPYKNSYLLDKKFPENFNILEEFLLLDEDSQKFILNTILYLKSKEYDKSNYLSKSSLRVAETKENYKTKSK